MNLIFPELPYAYNALEECIDAETMTIHYNKHHRGYYDKFMKAIAQHPNGSTDSLEQIFAEISLYDVSIRNNGGGFYNHNIFWNSMTPNARDCQGDLHSAIIKKWGSMENLKTEFSDKAKAFFASGWLWLMIDQQNELQIVETKGHDNPLMDICETRGQPLLVLDVWEHAYYLRYRNERDRFISSWWNIVNWKYAEDKYSLLFS